MQVVLPSLCRDLTARTESAGLLVDAIVVRDVVKKCWGLSLQSWINSMASHLAGRLFFIKADPQWAHLPTTQINISVGWRESFHKQITRSNETLFPMINCETAWRFHSVSA